MNALKMCVFITMKYYSAIERMQYWYIDNIKELENMILNEISQIKKKKQTTQYINPFLWNIQNRQIHRDTRSSSHPQELGTGEKREQLLSGCGVPFQGDKLF